MAITGMGEWLLVVPQVEWPQIPGVTGLCPRLRIYRCVPVVHSRTCSILA